MADWLNIAGGAGQGYVQGDQDNQRRAEFLFMQNQRKRAIEQQKLDDALTAQLKGVRGAGTYEDQTVASPDAPLHDTGLGVDAGPVKTKKTVVTAADADRRRAEIMAGGGRLQDIQAAATLRQNAYQADQQDRAAKVAKAQDVFTTAAQMSAMGNNVGAMQHLSQAYDQVPDGHKLVVEQRGGVPHAAIAGPDGRYVTPPTPITAQSVQDMIQRGVMMTTPELMVKGRELATQETTAGAHVMTAEAAKTNATTAANKAYWETIGQGGTASLAKSAAEEAYLRAHANYFNAKTAAEKEGGAESYGTPIPMVDAQGNPTYGIPTKKGTGGPGITPISMPTGWSFPKPTPVMNDQQKTAYTALMKMDQEGAFDAKGGRAKRDAFISSNKLDKFVETDPITKALQAASPPTPATKATSAAGATPPAEDAHKYNRSRVRGGYDYTLTSRGGKTKAEWAAEDAKLGITR
jgi:hypothetical protein